MRSAAFEWRGLKVVLQGFHCIGWHGETPGSLPSNFHAIRILPQMGALASAWLLVSNLFYVKEVHGCILACFGKLEFLVKYYTLKHMLMAYQLLELVATLLMVVWNGDFPVPRGSPRSPPSSPTGSSPCTVSVAPRDVSSSTIVKRGTVHVVSSFHQNSLDAMMGKNSIIGCFDILFFLVIISISSRSKFSHAADLDTLLPSQSLRDGQTLVSANKTFVFGFFSPGSSTNRYVGIWYYRVRQQTVVWVANRANPVGDGSGVVMFGRDGNLILVDGMGNSLVLAYGLGTSKTSLNILDSGNLILRRVDNSSSIVWQSFDYPTDTFLPGMKLGLSGRINWLLSSWKSVDDPAPGDFFLGLDPTGEPQFLIWQKGTMYWKSGVWDGQRFSLVPEMDKNYSYDFFFYSSSDEKYFSYSIKSDVISRLIMDTSGRILQLIWFEDMESWLLFWAQPRPRCDVYNLCGEFGVCKEERLYLCECLQGFQPASLQDWNKGANRGGCLRKTNLQCEGGRNRDQFLEMPSMKLAHADAITVNVVGAKECEAACYKYCNCTAYSFSMVCSLWLVGLSNLQQIDPSSNSTGETLYIRLAASEFQGKKQKLHIMVTVLVPLAVLSCCFVCFLWFRRQRNKGIRNSPEEKSLFALSDALSVKIGKGESGSDFSFLRFTDIEKATNNFSPENKLGEGGFGPVYKGQFPEGQEIAVKRLSARSGQGLAEFRNEITLIAKLQHRNLVKLLGCCIGGEKMLVYEYMPNKSLDFLLFDSTKRTLLDWSRRFLIIEGIAQGILYLHKHSRLRIIHRDLKASNILLDADMNPKISDFGMARIFGSNQTQANTNRVVGTYGYMAPEYASQGQFSIKSDVFSFGVLLLEIISGKRNTCLYRYKNSLNLLGYAWELWKEDNPLGVVDASLLADTAGYPESEVSRCIHVALMCVQENAADRPTISDVIAVLRNESVALPAPKQPAFFSVTTAPEADHRSNLDADLSLNQMTITTPQGR